ncbi:MAG: hypothetical protein A2176_15460 [Spirochaetes bacterium RBG_13_51_14]|nr:MAG: hypothetical protein A2176_15460 [Spirochaetes bacterium RBG_13_51_14]
MVVYTLLICLLTSFTFHIIIITLYIRSRDPQWYHINYFGEKVYEKGIVKQIEFLGIFFTLPFFLLIGAFFVSRLITIIMFGHI